MTCSMTFDPKSIGALSAKPKPHVRSAKTDS